MLKNPVHFLRKDAKTLEYPLFTAYYYERDPNTVKKINEAVSYRFLLLNESITHAPQQYHKLLRNSFFTAKQRLDFRLESPFTDYPRLQVAAGTTDLNAVMRHKITRRIKYPALELFQKHAKKDTDTIFIAKPYALFASYEEIQKEILNSLKQATKATDPTCIEDLNCPEASRTFENYIYLLTESYKSNPELLKSCASKVHSEIHTESSPIAVSYK